MKSLKITNLEEVETLTHILMEELDCARALTVSLLVKYREWDQIATLATVPSHYLDSLSYFKAVQATDFIRKLEELPTTIDKDAATLEKWTESERQCFKTNRRLAQFLDIPIRKTENPVSIENVILKARRLIRQWLGPLPSELVPRFGPGATISDKSRTCLIPDKLSSLPTATRDADFTKYHWYGTAWGRACVSRGHDRWKIVRGNIYFTVNKDGKIHRACAKGPSINLAYQLGVGKLIRRRLKYTAGIDLRRGQQYHRQAACLASISGHMATIDLSSASDCVAHALVRLLLPPGWFDLLNWLREPFTYVPIGQDESVWWRLEKFSAMGNGFTFELESLLFLALSCAVGGLTPSKTCLVFGDDIIVPTEQAQDVVSCLEYFGFTPNTRKTFLSGPFRESCGGDFWLGRSVRPYQLENAPTEPQDWISVANGIKRSFAQIGYLPRKPWWYAINRLPSVARLFGPTELGDLVINSDEIQAWSTRTKFSIRYVKTYAPVRFRRVFFSGFRAYGTNG